MSDPQLHFSNKLGDIGTSDLKLISSHRLSSYQFDKLINRHISDEGGRKKLQAELEILAPLNPTTTAQRPKQLFHEEKMQLKMQFQCEQLEKKLKEKENLSTDYYLKLLNIYNGFKVNFFELNKCK